MALQDPIAAYNAESNADALLVQRFLESEGIEAFVTEDHSPAGYLMLGTVAEIHKPQVWVNRSDSERVAQLLTEYERRKLARDADRTESESKSVAVTCEDCGKTSMFAASLIGTVQDCPHCGSYVDVGEVEWPDGDSGQDDQSANSTEDTE